MAFYTSLLKQVSLYRLRYFLGYGFVVILLFVIVSSDLGIVPNGISQAEAHQAVASSTMRFGIDMAWVVNAPYNILQKTAIHFLGVSRTAIVLPSMIFGVMTIVLFMLTLKQWFRHSVAVVATAVAVTSIPFITMLRSGLPDIMLPFWTILLLYGAVKLLIKRDNAFIWKCVIVVALLGLLYTPLGIYPMSVIVASAMFHPHIRSRLRHIPRHRFIILVVAGAVGVTPLIIHSIHQPGTIADLAGIRLFQDALAQPKHHLAQVFDAYLNIARSGFSGTVVVPFFNIASLSLMLLGLFTSSKQRFTARSYVLLAWGGMTAIMVWVAPQAIALVCIPAMLFLALGVDTLVAEWYKLFPRNPYARIAGLIPLTILFLGIALGNVAHYFNTHEHLHNPFYSQSLKDIQHAVRSEGAHEVTLVTTPDMLTFYTLLKKQHPLLTVTTTPPVAIDQPTLITPDVTTNYTIRPSRIATSAFQENAVTLRVYRPNTK